HQLHDEVAQTTASLHLALEEIERELRPRGREKLRTARALLYGLEERLRQLAHELRPTILDDLGLAPALGFLAEGFTSRSGIMVEVKGELGADRPEPLIETALYRIVQEALANVGRHARAHRATIRLGRRKDLLVCSIRDDGVGFDPEAAARSGNGGLGLLGIRERLDALGGRLDVRSAAGRGAELRVTISMRRPAHSLPRPSR